MSDRFKSKKIFSSVTEFRQAVADESQSFVYGRGAHPVLEEANQLFAAIDGRESALNFASGMGAISALLCTLLKSGDHLIFNKNCYSWTKHFVEHHLKKWGVEVSWIDDQDPSALHQASQCFRSNTKLLFLESPLYFSFETPLFAPWIREAKSRGVLTAIDNTFAGPGNFSLAREVDIGVYSATKIIVGNGQDLGGFLSCSRALRKELFVDGLMSLGAAMSWRVGEQMIEGLKSYPSRLKKIGLETRMFLEGLSGVPGIAKVHSPWYRDGKYFANPEFSHPVGLLSLEFDVNTTAEMERVCDRLRVFQLGVSYGAPEALAMPSCAFVRKGHDVERSPGFVRLALGEESADHLLDDLRQALS